MTLTELEEELKKLPLPERAAFLDRVQLTDAELDELEDILDVNNPAVQKRIGESSADACAGRVRPAQELLAELREEEQSKRRT